MKTVTISIGALLILAATPFCGGDPAMSETRSPSLATFGGGCFWCLEAAFEELAGVTKVVSGYAGGDGEATYQAVCSGETGHAEVVQVSFDPEVIGYEDLLKVFFGIHDPTTPDRQGADVGTQYRSIILAHDAEQRSAAERFVRDLDASGAWGSPVVTEIVDLERFHAAEPHHQDYFRNNPTKGYCRLVVAPKVEKVRAEFPDRLK